MPDQLIATVEHGGSVELEAGMRVAFWWLASLGTVAINTTVTPHDARREARWSDGPLMYMSADGPGLSDGVQSYSTSTRVWAQLVAYAAASPSRVAALVASSGATMRIADLPGTERTMTAVEISAVSRSLGDAFSVSEGELPGDLEQPFPIYEIVSGETVVQLRRDHYGSVSRYGAFAHDGSLYDVVRRAVPVPSFSVDDPRSLFLADTVTIEEDGLLSMTGRHHALEGEHRARSRRDGSVLERVSGHETAHADLHL